MTDFITNLKNESFLLSGNNDGNDPKPKPKPVTETEEVEEDVRPGGNREENPKK